jgi:hypothetical protein
MALGDPYATLTEYKAFEEIDEADTSKDTRLTLALKSASRAVDMYCQRTFNKADNASARVFHPVAKDIVIVDDFYETAGVEVRVGTLAGSFGSAWSPTAYYFDPSGGVKDGVEGWPVERIMIRPGFTHGICRDDQIEVTAKWGWAEVPAEVKLATLLLASRYYKLGDAPLGVVGLKRFNSSRASGGDQAADLLCDYVKEPYLG